MGTKRCGRAVVQSRVAGAGVRYERSPGLHHHHLDRFRGFLRRLSPAPATRPHSAGVRLRNLEQPLARLLSRGDLAAAGDFFLGQADLVVAAVGVEVEFDQAGVGNVFEQF